MSDQGDTGQWRPASHTGPYSEPDEPTGPLPTVSGGDAAPPAFPPVAAPSDDRRAADDALAGGFPGTSATRGSPSPVKRERAPFEPADPPAVPPSPGPAPDEAPSSGADDPSATSASAAAGWAGSSPAPDEAASSGTGEWPDGPSSGAGAWSVSSFAPAGAEGDPGDASASGPGAWSDAPSSGAGAWSETPASAPGTWAEASSATSDTWGEAPPATPGTRSDAPASGAWDEAPSSTPDTWAGTPSPAPETPDPSASGRHRAGPPDAVPAESTPPFGAEIPPVDPYDARDARHGYEVADPALGLGGPSAGSAARSSVTGHAAPEGGTASGHDMPDVASMWETPAYEAADASGSAGEPPGPGTSLDDAPHPFGAPGESFPGPPDDRASSGPAAGTHRAPGDHDADHEFFGSPDDPAHWDKVVAPSGPPPQPGKPSSGNLRLPDWMRQESGGAPAAGGSADATDYDDYGYEDDEGRSKLPLIAGLGVLVAGLVVAAGVYLLKDGGNGEPQAAAHTTSSGRTHGSATPKIGVPGARQARKALPMFRGRHTAPVGRIVDRRAGLSYPKLGRPWQMQPKNGQMTELGFSAGQYAVTEKAHGAATRWARLMSGRLGAADRGAYQGPGTEEAAAAKVAETYEARMYAFKHHRKPLASQPLDVGGHKGWLVADYLTYHRPASRATGDIFTVALVDTGRKEPAVLLMSVPNTHRRLYPDIDYVMHALQVG